MMSFGSGYADYLFECLWWHSKTWPGARVHVCHDFPPERVKRLHGFDLDLTEEFVVPEDDVWVQRIKLLAKSPFENTLYLDSDVLSNPESAPPDLGDVCEALLDSADIMALPGMSLNHPWESEIFPSLFLQPNGGVILYKRSACGRLFQDWLEHYSHEHAHDQPALRAAIVSSGVRFLPLSVSWNFQGMGMLEVPPTLIHLTMGYRKKWLLNHSFCEKLLNSLSSGEFPKFLVDFVDAKPLPSAWQNGPRLSFWIRGIRLWFWSRMRIAAGLLKS